MPFVLFLETAVWAVCQLVPDMRHSIGDFPLTAAAVLVALTISWAISLLMPLIVSLLHPIAELTSAEKQSLSGLLTTQAGYDSFHDFLKLEFSIENLYFWSEVNLYRQHAERLLMSSDESLIDEAIGELLDIARGIYADFIKDSAPNEVNISAPIRKRIDTVMEYAFA